MSLTLKPIVSLSVMRDDKEFQFMVPNGVAYSLAYDAAMEIVQMIYTEIEKEQVKQKQILKEMLEQPTAAPANQ